MNPIINWIISAASIILVAYLLPGVSLGGLVPALILAVVLAAINIFIKPILVVLTLPINILTLGFFTLVINALLVMLASNIVPSFTVDSFWWAFLFALLLSAVSSILGSINSEA